MPKKKTEDSDLSSSSNEEDAFPATQAPSMTQAPKVASAASSDLDSSSDDEPAPPSRANRLTGKPQLMGISPILAKLSRKDTSTPKKGSPAKVTPLRPTQQSRGSSDSDESDVNTPAMQAGKSREFPLKATQARSINISKTQANLPKASDSSDWESNEEEAKKPPVRTKPQSPMKAKVPELSDSTDLDSDEEEAKKPVPVRTKPQSPKKVGKSSVMVSVPKASDSSDLDSDDEEPEKSVPVRPKVQSPVKTRAPIESDSDSDVDSDDEDMEKVPLPAPIAKQKPLPLKKAIAQTVEHSDTDMESDGEESVVPPTSAVQSKAPNKSTARRKSSESESESSSDGNKARTSFQAKPKPASPTKSIPTAVAMEVDESSSDDEALLREAMKRVNQAKEQAKAGAISRKTAPLSDSGPDSELETKSPKGRKGSNAKKPARATKTTKKTPKEAKKTPKETKKTVKRVSRTPKKSPVKAADSFPSKEIISGSEDIVSSDSEPEKLGPIRRNISLNKSIASNAEKEKEPVPVPDEPSEEEEEDVEVTDDTPGLLYLEDVGSDDEVWLVRCPINVKHSDLIGHKLVLGGVSKFTVGDTQFESRTYQHADDHTQLSCLLRSKNVDGLLKVVSVPTAGQVTFTRRMKLNPIVLPATTSMEGKTTSLPSGLKTRHPLFGADFQNAITVRDKTEDRPQTTKVAAKPAKKDAKRRSVTFRENPSFERTQPSDQESSEEKEVEKEVEESDEDEDSDEGPASDDLVSKMVSKALLGKQATPRKRALEKSKTPTKPAKSLHPEEKPVAKRKSPKAEKLLNASLLEKSINENASPADKAAIEPAKKAMESPKTKRKSLKLTPVADHKKLASIFDSSDSSVSKPRTSKAKSSKQNDLSNAESHLAMHKKLASFLDDSDSSVSNHNVSYTKDIPSAKSQSTKAKKATSALDSTDSSASNKKASPTKKLIKKKDSIKESPLTAKKSLVNKSDTSITKPEAQHAQVFNEKDDSHAESRSSKTKEKSLESSSFCSTALLTDFLNKSLGSSVKKSIENATVQESHSDSPSTKVKARSQKAPELSASMSKVSKKGSNLLTESSAAKPRRKSLPTKSLTNGPDILKGDMNAADIITVPESKKKAAKKVTPTRKGISAKSLTPTSKSKSPKGKTAEKLVKGSLKTKEDSSEGDPGAQAEDNFLTKLFDDVVSVELQEQTESLASPLPKSKSRKSSGADSVMEKKARVAIKAKRRIGKTSVEEVTDLGPKAELVDVDKQLLAEQQSVIDKLLRQCIKSNKKRQRDDGDEEVTAAKSVKKRKKELSADNDQNTPTSSKTSSKLPVKKYRQLTLTATIPPGIAELSPASAKAGSRKSSHKVEDSKSPALGDTTPSKQKKKRKLDSSISDLETGSKKLKVTAHTEMGSQDASFTSKFQKAGYAGPDSPLPPSSSLGASQSDIDVRFESQDSIGLVANLDTNQFELPKTKKVRKSGSSRDKSKLDSSIDFEDFGSGGNLVSSTQKQSPKVLPGSLSSQGSDFSVGSQEKFRSVVPTGTNQDSPFVFKAPALSKGKRSKAVAPAEESGFESDISSSRKRAENDGFESDVTLKLFRTQADPIALAKQRAKKHPKNVR